jgi:uncharacterized protein YukE
LQTRADRIDDLSARLRRLDLHGVWEGQAADSFLSAVSELSPHLDFASEADRATGNALGTYAQALEDAQLNAGRAIGVWEYGQRLTADAKRDHTVAIWGASTELAFDPGESQRANAQRILQLARDEVTDAGNRAASAVRASQSTKPTSLGFWDLVGGTVGNFLGNMGNSAASLMNAMAQHPDEYASVVMGLLSMQGGAAAFAGGLALDATGAGTVAGVAVNVASAGLVVGGATVASAGMSKLLQQAASEDRVQPFSNGSAPPSNLVGYSSSRADDEIVERYWGDPKTLDNHFERHGPDFGAASPTDYVKQAADFLERGLKEKFPTKIDKDGIIRIYDPETDTFGCYNPDGTIKTIFKPGKNGFRYFENQGGERLW